MKNWYGFSWVYVKKAKSVQTGDIIVFVGNDKKRYAHRIIKIENGKFTTKGDNFKESKSYEINVSVQNIRGKITWSWP